MARFNAPPGWDQPPAGFTPPSNWQPSSHWPPAPANWPFWVDDNGQPTAPPPGAWSGPAGTPSAPQNAGQPGNQFGGPQQPAPHQFGGQPYNAQPGAGQPMTAAPAPKKKTGLLIGLIAGGLALLLLIGTLLFFFLNSEPTLSQTDVSRAYTSGLKLGNHTFKQESASADKGKATDEKGSCGLKDKGFADKADYTVNGKEDTTSSKSVATAMTVHFSSVDAAHKAFDEYTKKLDGCSSDGVSVKLNKKQTGSHPAWSTFTATSQGLSLNLAMIQWGNTLTMNMALDSIDGETVAKDIKDQMKKG